MLYRFDARNGLLLESRPWEMGKETPMSFLIDGTDLYAISDVPMKDKTFEHQLVQFHTVIEPAAADHWKWRRPVERDDGSALIWRDGMLIAPN